jgi:hypothetical protein
MSKSKLTKGSKPQTPSVIPGLKSLVEFDASCWRGDVPNSILRDAEGKVYIAVGKGGTVEIDGEPVPLSSVPVGSLQPVPLFEAIQYYLNCKKFDDGWSGDADDLFLQAIEELKAKAA